MDYGNSDFLKYGYADLTFERIKIYYKNDNIIDDAKLPPNCDYIGSDISTEALCLDHHDKNIYLFGGGEKDLWYYGGLQALLFFSLFQFLREYQYFDKIITNVKIDDIEAFKQTYLDYEIPNIFRYNRYFFKDGKLILCDDEFYSYNLYEGGILNHIIDDRP